MRIFISLTILSFCLTSLSELCAQSTFETVAFPSQSMTVTGGAADSSGNYLLCGETTIGGTPFGGGDTYLFLSKFDEDGTLLWTRYYSSPAEDGHYGISVATQPDRYALCAFTIGSGTASRDGSLIVTDTSGSVINTIRADHLGVSNAFHSLTAGNGEWVLSGRTSAGLNGSYDMQLISFDLEGNLNFAKNYGGDDWDWAHWAEPYFDGYLIAGYGDSFEGGFSDPFLLRLDSLGDPIWAKTISTPSAEESMFISSSDDGSIYISGYTLGMIPSNPGNKGYIAKLDADGNIQWCKAVPEMLSIPAMFISDDGRIVAVGDAIETADGLGGQDVGFIAISSEGEFLSGYRYGSAENDFVANLVKTEDEGYLLAASTAGFGGGTLKPYIIKTTGTGNTNCTAVPATFSLVDVGIGTVDPIYSTGSGLSVYDWSQELLDEPIAAEPVCCADTAIASFSALYWNEDTTYLFVNQSNNFDAIQWVLDGSVLDNTTDSLWLALAPGEYTMCLQASNACGDSTVCESIVVLNTSLYESESTLKIYPNPVTDLLNIESTVSLDQVAIFDAQGRQVTVIPVAGREMTVLLDFLNPGPYLVRGIGNQGTLWTRIMVN